jgi:phosphatidylglycerophosphatase A
MPQNRNNRAAVPVFSKIIATGFFSGYSPVVPGTAGSAVGLALYAVPGMEAPLILGIATVITFFLGVVTSNQMEQMLGEDPPVVVVDEIVGMWISLLFLPKGILVALIAFVLFRIYDIVKPPPARQVEHFKNGWGIMLDDVFAGVYANISVRLIMLLFPAIS